MKWSKEKKTLEKSNGLRDINNNESFCCSHENHKLLNVYEHL